jgi:hypothetical protein
MLPTIASHQPRRFNSRPTATSICIFGTGYHFFTIVDFIMISLCSKCLVAFANQTSGVDSTVGLSFKVAGIEGRKTAQPARVIAEMDDEDDGLLTIVSMDEPTFGRLHYKERQQRFS